MLSQTRRRRALGVGYRERRLRLSRTLGIEACEVGRAEAPVASRPSWHDVEVEVGHLLAGLGAVVLIEGDAVRIEGVDHRPADSLRRREDRGCFFRR